MEALAESLYSEDVAAPGDPIQAKLSSKLDALIKEHSETKAHVFKLLHLLISRLAMFPIVLPPMAVPTPGYPRVSIE